MIVETKDGEAVSIDGFAADPNAAPKYITEQPDVLVVINHPLSAGARECVAELVRQIERIVAQDRARPASPSADTEPPTPIKGHCEGCE